MFRDVVHVVNIGFKNEIQWPSAKDVLEVATGFNQLCRLLGVVGAIDKTHFAISKPWFTPANYFYFKFSGYSMTC